MAENRLLDNVFADGEMGCLFQRASFYHLHAENNGHFFEWQEKTKVVATVHFTDCGNGLWRSPARGTFAGFASSKALPMDSLFAFHDAAESVLKSAGAQHLEILPSPMAHDPVFAARQLYLLRARGYHLTQCDLNHSLEVDSRSLADRMTYGNLKRMRKCLRDGLVAQELPGSALPAVYDTIATNRTHKGHAMSMSLQQIQAMADQIPDALVLFGCRDGDVLAAAALCLRLSPHVIYVFYWGDLPGYASHSPVVALANAIYAYCQQQSVRLLDVGTSTIDRAPNFGLIAFKQGLGFTESLKTRMRKAL